MRLKDRYKKEDVRVIKKFLFFPRRDPVPGIYEVETEKRWLEVVHELYEYQGRSYSPFAWRSLGWVTMEDIEKFYSDKIKVSFPIKIWEAFGFSMRFLIKVFVGERGK